MTTIYEVFNTKSEQEFSSFLDKLSLSTTDLINVMDIAESRLLDVKAKQQKLLEYMSGTNYSNYKLTLDQIKKGFKRVLKEDVTPVQPSLNLNQIMELNDLVTLVASKLKAPNCMQGVFNIIKSKLNGKAANAFLSMVQQADVNTSSLKFNTELSINGQNLAQAIYAIKNDIEMFVNGLETPKKEPEKTNSETVTEALISEADSTVDKMIRSVEANIDSANSSKDLEWIINVIDNAIQSSRNTEQSNTLATLKSKAQTKLNSINEVNPKVEECLAQNVVSNACGETTFDSLLNNLKPTMISITVNKDNGDFEDCEDTCEQPVECNQALRQQIVDLIAQLCNAYQSTLEETCSAGATCAGNVSGFAKPLGKKPRKRKETEDVKLFKESIRNNEYAGIMLPNGNNTIDTIMYRVFEGKGYLYINDAIVGATTTESILEAFDDYYNDCLETPVYEGFTHQELDLLMEDMLNPLNQPTDGDEKQMEKDLEQQFKTNPNIKLTVDDEKNTNQSMADQELVGIDDSDPENKQFITKDPATNKVKINKINQLHVQGNV